MSTTWRHSVDLDDPVDLIGFTVEARDGGWGVVDDASWDTDSEHLVVHTGEDKVLLPVGVIEAIAVESKSLRLGMTWAQVMDAEVFEPRKATGRLLADQEEL